MKGMYSKVFGCLSMASAMLFLAGCLLPPPPPPPPQIHHHRDGSRTIVVPAPPAVHVHVE